MQFRKWADGYEQVAGRAERGLPIHGQDFKRLDLVKLGNGQTLVVTGFHPNRPTNCYSGVLERGQGKEYVFGPKHRPVKVGTVTEDHPALQMNQDRKEANGASKDLLSLARLLVKTVLKGETLTAKALAEELEAKGF